MANSEDESCTNIYVNMPEADNRDCSYISSHSSLSDPEAIELPNSIHDEPKFDDLAGHLESVASSAWFNCTNHVQNQTVSQIGPPILTTAAKSNNSSRPKSQSRPFPEVISNHPVNAGNSEFEAVSPFHTSMNALSGSSIWPSERTGGLISKTSQLNGQLDAESVEIWSPGSVQLSEDDEDEDFGEFMSSAPLCELQTQENSTSTIPDDFRHSVADNPGTLERLLSHLEPALQSAFSQNLEFAESMGGSGRQAGESSGLPTVDYGDCQEGVHPSSASTHLGVWHRLFTPTRLTELQQQWSNSSVQRAFLQSINVNPGETKPAFAGQLGLLKPVQVASVLRQTGATTSSRRKTNLSDHSSAANAGELQGLEIFMTRKCSQSSPVTQDGCEKKFDAETGFLDLQTSNSYPTGPLSTMSGTPALSSTSSTVSQTIRSVLARLPNIRYMRSSNLVFPIPDDP